MNILILQTASKVFLTKPLPDNWYDLSAEMQYEFVESHIWEPFEGCDPMNLLRLITVYAKDIEIMIGEMPLSKNKIVDFILGFIVLTVCTITIIMSVYTLHSLMY